MNKTTVKQLALWLLVIGPVFLLLFGRSLVSLPPLNSHAVARHSDHARSAYTAMCNYDPNKPGANGEYFLGEDSAEDRVYHILCLPNNGRRQTWAIVITTISGFIVTAWLAQSRRTVKKLKGKAEESRYV